jgi:hypothetical protein
MLADAAGAVGGCRGAGGDSDRGDCEDVTLLMLLLVFVVVLIAAEGTVTVVGVLADDDNDDAAKTVATIFR